MVPAIEPTGRMHSAPATGRCLTALGSATCLRSHAIRRWRRLIFDLGCFWESVAALEAGFDGVALSDEDAYVRNKNRATYSPKWKRVRTCFGSTVGDHRDRLWRLARSSARSCPGGLAVCGW